MSQAQTLPVTSLPPGMTRVTPMLSYEEVASAADWLARAFGFRERLRYTEADGSVSHLEMEIEEGVIMLGRPGQLYQNPRHHRAECESARRMAEVPYVIDGVHVYVDDVDGHCERARRAGAAILREPEDQPYGRLYTAEDVEGHRWMFMSAPREEEAREELTEEGRPAQIEEAQEGA